MKTVKLSKYDRIFIIYLIILSTVLSSTFFYNHIWADEGTHLLLAVFYKDILSYALQTHTLSFHQLYNYGINYLVSYPKLQIAYTPLFHITTSLAFFVFGASEFAGRFVNLIYTIGSFSIFYLLVKRFFDQKTAFISALLFSLSPISLIYGSRAMMDFTSIFWLLASLYVFSLAEKNNKLKYYATAGFFAFLSALGKQMGAIVLLFFAVMILKNPFKKVNWNLGNFKKLFILFLTFSMFFLPYLYLMNLVGGLKLNELVAIDYASEQGEPTSILDYGFWLFYISKPITLSPAMPILLVSLFFYCYKKNSHSKPLLLFFLIFYICLTLIPNKELRFSQFFMLPAYVAASHYLNKTKKYFAIILILCYVLVSYFVFVPSIVSYPTNQIADFIYQNNKQGGNVAFFSDNEPLYSSSVMWYVRTMDESRGIRFYRSCVFDQKNETEILSIMKDNNIYFVIYSSWSENKNIDKIKDKLDLKLEVGGSEYKTLIYTFKDFEYKKTDKCNFICLTKEVICTV